VTRTRAPGRALGHQGPLSAVGAGPDVVEVRGVTVGEWRARETVLPTEQPDQAIALDDLEAGPTADQRNRWVRRLMRSASASRGGRLRGGGPTIRGERPPRRRRGATGGFACECGASFREGYAAREYPRPGGGIGRHDGLKIRCFHERAGSSPAPGTPDRRQPGLTTGAVASGAVPGVFSNHGPFLREAHRRR
jgi:hypothetical protein